MKQKGQALVETVLVLPFLILMLLFIVQTVMIFTTYYITNYASFCGARAAVLRCGENDHPEVAARLAAGSALLALGRNPETIGSALSIRSRVLLDQYEVTVTYPCKNLIPVWGGIDRYIYITASTCLPFER